MKKSKPFEARNKYLAFKSSVKNQLILSGRRNKKEILKSEKSSKSTN